MQASPSQWTYTRQDLRGLDAIRARDLIVECFYAAQRDTMARRSDALGVAYDEEYLRMDAEGSVRNAFKRTGGDFRHPTKDSLEKAVLDLMETSAAMGTPMEVINHHRRQIAVVLAGLPS